jgi:hypothetical protein
MLDRIIRVIRLDRSVFAEVEHDETLTSEAAIIVVIVSLLSALGAAFAGERFLLGFVGEFLSGILLNWILWSLLTWWIGTNLFDGQADVGEMLRVLGYANAPRLLGLFRFIPCLGWILVLAGAILSLIAAFFAIQEGLDLETGETLATVVISWLVSFVLSLIIGFLSAGTALTVNTITGGLGG